MLRKGSCAVHYLETPVEEGSSVHLEVDWQRRFDHMQQHSGKSGTNDCLLCLKVLSTGPGQHLITAIADREFGFKTTSW